MIERTFQRLCKKKEAYGKKRFQVVLEESTFGASGKIYADTLTGVNDLFVTEGYAGGLTPLLGTDGKPVVTPTGDKPEF